MFAATVTETSDLTIPVLIYIFNIGVCDDNVVLGIFGFSSRYLLERYYHVIVACSLDGIIRISGADCIMRGASGSVLYPFLKDNFGGTSIDLNSNNDLRLRSCCL